MLIKEGSEIRLIRVIRVPKKLNRITNLKECDATDDDSSNAAKFKKNSSYY